MGVLLLACLFVAPYPVAACALLLLLLPQILKNLCRAGKAERQRVLLWFAAVLTSNEGRAKAAHAHMLLQQQTPESADPLHSFLISMQQQLLLSCALVLLPLHAHCSCEGCCSKLLVLLLPPPHEAPPAVWVLFCVSCMVLGDTRVLHGLLVLLLLLLLLSLPLQRRKAKTRLDSV